MGKTEVARASGIPVYCAHDAIVPIEKCIPNPRNPNKHPDSQIELLAKIIRAQGWRTPITVSTRSGFVVRGHGRLLVAQALGVSEVPVDYQDYASEAEEWADLIADNRIAELAERDDAALGELIRELEASSFDLELTGFTGRALEQLLADLQDKCEVVEDEAPDPPETPVTRPGDLWVLGRHRLLCGDATALRDVERLMGGAQADMVFVDPPYNVDYVGKTKDRLKIENDKMTSRVFREFLLAAFTNLYRVTVAGGAAYVCHAETEGINFRAAMAEAGWEVKQCLIWVKNSPVLGRQDYHWQHETILYGWKPGAAHRWFGGRKQATILEDAQWATARETDRGVELSFTNGVQNITLLVPSYEVLHQGDDSMTSVWRIERPSRNPVHPTMKPVAVPARAIRNSSRPGEAVVDTFAGSGSTLIAAEQLDRSCYAMEIDPRYCDVIIQRWQNLTGQKAVREDGTPYDR